LIGIKLCLHFCTNVDVMRLEAVNSKSHSKYSLATVTTLADQRIFSRHFNWWRVIAICVPMCRDFHRWQRSYHKFLMESDLPIDALYQSTIINVYTTNRNISINNIENFLWGGFCLQWGILSTLQVLLDPLMFEWTNWSVWKASPSSPSSSTPSRG